MDTSRIKRYWGTQRVARVCQVTPGTVANWIDQGLLKGHKTPTGRRRVGVRTVVQKVDGLDAVIDAIRQALRTRRRQGAA